MNKFITKISSQQVTGWCALWAERIIGTYIYKNEDGHNVAVNGERYRAMMSEFCL